MQNSQRVPDAKPRTAPMARRRDGDIAPYRNGTRAVRKAMWPRNGSAQWDMARAGEVMRAGNTPGVMAERTPRA